MTDERPANTKAELLGQDRRARRHHRLRRAAGDRRHAQDELHLARHGPGRRHPVDGDRGSGLLALADPRRLDQRRRLHARLSRHGASPAWSTWWSPPAPRSSTWISSRRSASSTTRRPVRCRRPRPARPLHRPHLRHLHRRGRAAGLRSRDQGDRRRAGAAALFVARVHPRDGPLAGRRQRQEAGQPDPDRVRGGRADLLPGLHRLLGRLRPGEAPGGADQGGTALRDPSTRSPTSAS